MSLNATLDRLKAEREAREARMLVGTAPAYDVKTECEEIDADFRAATIASLAERIFFQRMLKDINPGLSEGKIDAMIERSVMIATKLYKRLYE
ncbi:MAG: hypothetical protein NC204_05665 [Candidatus Amulumruptor caecigallinarius]|nr:hypothetical protein [Candidatus Amulumruptor caecigallinarius]